VPPPLPGSGRRSNGSQALPWYLCLGPANILCRRTESLARRQLRPLFKCCSAHSWLGSQARIETSKSVLASASDVGGTTEPILMEASRKDEMGDEIPRIDWRRAGRLFPVPVIEVVHLSTVAGAVQSR
jgi:hypothetical protein